MKEYDLRGLDEDGEAIHIESFTTELQAVNAMRRLIGGDIVAAVVELHTHGVTRNGYSFSEYRTVKTEGSTEVIKAWEGVEA